MKNLVNLMKVVLLSFLLVACKSPSATSTSGTVDAAAEDTTIATDAAGNTTTTSTAADGTITTTITSADGTSVTTVALPAEVDNLGSAGGVWRGTFTPDDKTKATVFYKAFITPSRKMVMLSDSEASFVIQGSDMLQSTAFAQTSDGITINLQEYVKENDGTAPVDVVITGNLTPTDNIKGTYVRGAETGSVLFIYDPIYERGDRTPFFYTQSTYWKISKTLADASTYSAAFGINDSFKITGFGEEGMIPVFDPADATKIIGYNFPSTVDLTAIVDTEGCNYDGNLDIVDTHYFIYNITLVVTNCTALNGTYEGLATLEEEYSIESHPHTHYEFMTFGVSDGTRTINNRLTLDYFGV